MISKVFIRLILYVIIGVLLGIVDIFANSDWEYWAIIITVFLIDLNSNRK